MHTCKCGRTFKYSHHYNLHKPHCNGPKYCQNPECKKLLLTLEQKKFCSSSCSAKVTLKGRKQSDETRVKISKSLGGKGTIHRTNHCKLCGTLTKNPKYCSLLCSSKDKRSKIYDSMSLHRKKKILWSDQNKKCNFCNFNKFDPVSGPYEIHHIDGNPKNRSRKNEILLCCNCHYMTENHRFKGRKHKRESKEKLSVVMKNVSSSNR